MMKKKGFWTGLAAGLLFFMPLVYAGHGPNEPARDVKFLLGMYYGNGEQILIREDHGELQMFYRLPGDHCFSKSNMFPLVKHRFDSYTMLEAGPMTRFGEVSVKFDRDEDGYGVAVKIGGHVYSRLFFGNEHPDRPSLSLPVRNDWEQLRKLADAVSVPAALSAGLQEPLVNLRSLKGLRLQNVYATKDNLFGAPLYTAADLYLNKSAAAALQKAQAEVAKWGYGLVVWDAYRPWSVSKLANLALPADKKDWLEDPDIEGSPHNTGMAVDVSLYEPSTGVNIDMISGFDEIGPRQYRDFPGGTEYQRYLRRILREAMEKSGFIGADHEWWHYEYRKNVQYAHLNIPLEKLK